MQRQIRPAGRLHLERAGQRDVAVQMPLVEFIEDDGPEVRGAGGR